MTWTTITETNLTGVDGMLLYTASTWVGFIPLFLFVLFLIVLLASYFAQIRTRGFGDFWASFSVAGIFTTIIALIMSMMTQIANAKTYTLINGITLAICISVTIVGVVILLISRERD